MKVNSKPWEKIYTKTKTRLDITCRYDVFSSLGPLYSNNHADSQDSNKPGDYWILGF